ncbi:sugar ABC transporter permease [Ruania suaedae]|uniref:carbohydrate ABC transporter permease n=1 Tax=Ruania suaedae TaxID=2897774 RepID=UPI001E2D1EDF|nr:sugar ABC transporter permease [Ruania suaedae]UFU02884.1 sugar ABC transporter permease [Ruania suaedae]
MTRLESTTGAPAATPGTATGRSGRARDRRAWSGAWFVVPFGIFFVLFLVWPIVYGFWLSLTDASLVASEAPGFVGFSNYANALSDAEMWRSLWHTIAFTAISTVPLVLLALVMAIAVYTGIRGQWLWRFAFFAPYLLPVATVAMVWTWLLEENLGLVNQTLASLGIAGPGWLSEETPAMASVVIATVWWTVGFNFLLYLSSLQSIPTHLYEAAAIDGAGPMRRIWSIMIPQLRGITSVVLVLQLLSSLKVFDQIYLMTKGGPDGATRSLLLYVYDTGFTGYRLGYSAAISYIFLAMIVIVSIAQARIASRKGQQS